MADNNYSTTKVYQGQQKEPAPDAQEQNSTQSSNLKNKGAGAMILLLMFGILWVYGWASQITLTGTSFPSNLQTQSIFATYFTFSAIFTVIGFGLLLSYFKYQTATSFFISIFVVSFTIIISPIFSKFWVNVFLTDFSGKVISTNLPDRFVEASFGGLNIQVDFFNLKYALLNSISQLALLTVIIGKINVIQVIILSFLYNFVWNLNHFLCVLVQMNGPDVRIFDDYQISNVYLFAGSFAIAATLILKRPPSFDKQFSHNQVSAIMSYLGTFFLFLSFCTTTSLFPAKYTRSGSQNVRAFIWVEGFISIFFALSASVISTYSFSILFDEKIGIREAILGTLTGAVMYGSVAGTCINISAAISVGIFSGLISALFYSKIYVKINKDHIYDSMGGLLMFGVSLLGTFFIAPIVLKTYWNYQVTLPTLVNTSIANKDIAGYVLGFVGITIAIGFLTGVVITAFIQCFGRLNQKEFSDINIFKLQYGLVDEPKTKLSNPSAVSATQLNKL